MMMLKIAFRNIFRQKRRSILTGLSMLGSFVLASLSLAWLAGSYNDVINMFTRNQMGHIQIHHSAYLDRPSLHKTIRDLPALEPELNRISEIDSWTPRLYSAGLASVGEKTSGIRIIGIDPVREVQTTHFEQKITHGRMFDSKNSNETIVGKGLLKLLHASLNDEVVILSQGADGSMANDKYKIVGIVDSGDEIGDRTAFYLSMKSAQELLVMDGWVHEIAITVKSLDDVENVSALLAGRVKSIDSKLAVEPWQVFAKEFYNAMLTDRKGNLVMLFIIFLVVGVGVLNTVLMSVLERRREYGVLKALGTKPGEIVKMVLAEVTLLSGMCIVLGCVLALGVNYYFSINGITYPEPLTYGGMKFTTMRSEITADSFYIPTLTIFFSAFLVSIFPAVKAAHTDPARSMRQH